MKAARLHAYGGPLAIDEVPRPRAGPGEVVVKVGGSGFCHSDLHLIDGELRILPRFPITLGHENAGWVAELGAGVIGLREGDPVVVFGAWGCGRCLLCLSGSEQLCETPRWVGIFDFDGGYAEYLRVPEARYLLPLTRFEPREAAVLTDAALTPYRAVRKALPFLEPDHHALVIGLGGLGEYGLRLLRVLSGCPVIAVDVNERKLELARALGAEHALDGRDPDLARKILELTNGHGVAASFDFVGADSTLALAIGTTRSLGKVSQVGLAGGTARLKVLESNRFEVMFEATLWGTLKELHEVLALAESGRLGSIPLEYAPLESINEVYARVKSGGVDGRIVITPNEAGR